MKQLIISLSLVLISFIGLSQSVIKMDSAGNYVSVSQPRDSAKATGKTFTDSKGNKYPVFVSAKGKIFVVRVSKNTGKEYKQYLKLEN